MLNKRWFQAGIAILLLLVITKYFLEVKHLLKPFIVIVNTVFIPLLIAGVLFYATVPLQKLLESKIKKLNRFGSISIVLVVVLLFFGIVIYMIAAPITTQVNNLIKNIPTISAEMEKGVDFALKNKDNLPSFVDNGIESVTDSIQTIALTTSKFIIATITETISVTFTLLLVPFFYIFLLKDHEKLSPSITRFFKGERKEWVIKTLSEINKVLGNYVQGQLIISFLLSLMIFIGYVSIGLEYALLLAIFAFFMNMIPFIGPWVALAPAVIVGFLDEPMMAVWVILITLVAQQIESNIITPNIMGKSLDIHPLTVITIVLAAGGIAGFIGILIAIPTYATIKVVVKNVYKEREKIKTNLKRDVDKTT